MSETPEQTIAQLTAEKERLHAFIGSLYVGLLGYAALPDDEWVRVANALQKYGDRGQVPDDPHELLPIGVPSHVYVGTPFETILRLRQALIQITHECTAGKVAADVSTKFLLNVPAEVKAQLFKEF